MERLRAEMEEELERLAEAKAAAEKEAKVDFFGILLLRVFRRGGRNFRFQAPSPPVLLTGPPTLWPPAQPSRRAALRRSLSLSLGRAGPSRRLRRDWGPGGSRAARWDCQPGVPFLSLSRFPSLARSGYPRASTLGFWPTSEFGRMAWAEPISRGGRGFLAFKDCLGSGGLRGVEALRACYVRLCRGSLSKKNSGVVGAPNIPSRRRRSGRRKKRAWRTGGRRRRSGRRRNGVYSRMLYIVECCVSRNVVHCAI